MLEDFEGFALDVQQANFAGSFTITDATSIFGTGKAALIDFPGMAHRFAWEGDPQPVFTVSFDFFSGEGGNALQVLRLSFNHNSGGLVSGANNIARLAIRPGNFDVEGAVTESYTDDSFPINTPMRIHVVFNGSDLPIIDYYAGESLAAKSIEIWKEIDGVISHVGEGTFLADRATASLAFFGIATNSTYQGGSGFFVDNISWSEGAKGFVPDKPDATAELLAPRGIPAGRIVRLDFNLSEYPTGSSYEIVADKEVLFIGGADKGVATENGSVDVLIQLPDQSIVNFTLTVYDTNGVAVAVSRSSVVVFDFHKHTDYPHPSIINTQLQLDGMREVVLSNPDSVSGSYWKTLRSQPWSSLNHVHTPQTTVIVTAAGTNPSEDAFRDDGHAARSHALQWVVTGDPAHRDKALQILNDWGHAFQGIEVDTGGYGAQIRLECSWALPIWASAADIIRYHDGGSAGWAEEDMAVFAAFLHYLYLEADKNKLRMVPHLYEPIGLGYTNQTVSANWALMCYGVWSRNPEIFETGYLNLLHVLDDFSKPNGEIREVCRDTLHPQYSIVSLTDAAELAFNLGYDGLYTATFDGQDIPRLAIILEYFSNLMLGNTTDPCGGIGYQGQYRRYGNYEVPHNHYINRMGVDYLPNFRNMVENLLRTNVGMDKHFLLWAPLTHGMQSSGLTFWNAWFTLSGNVNTGDWMQWLNVEQAPWIYSHSLQNWIFMPEELIDDHGAWLYLLR